MHLKGLNLKIDFKAKIDVLKLYTVKGILFSFKYKCFKWDKELIFFRIPLMYFDANSNTLNFQVLTFQ
jgi:hypothetical protein